MDAILYIIAGPLFIISITAHFYVKFRMRPKQDLDSQDEYYDEFEDQQSDVARYNKWSKITFTAATVGVLLLFIAMIF